MESGKIKESFCKKIKKLKKNKKIQKKYLIWGEKFITLTYEIITF